MRALLINPWIYDFAAYDLWLKPFGLLRVAAALRRWGWEVDFIDCLDRFHPCLSGLTGRGRPRRDRFGCGKYPKVPVEKPPALREMERPYFRYGLPLEIFPQLLQSRGKPDLILVGSTMTYWYPGYFLAIEMAKKYFPSVPIILGGIYPRLCSEHARIYSPADGIHQGGGLPELVEILTERGFSLSPLTGEMDLMPAYDLLSDQSALAVRTGIGCPDSCSYCAASLLEPEANRRKPEAVAEEIEGYIKRYGTTDIAFYDNALLWKAPEHIDKILLRLIERNVFCRFHTPNGLHARFLNVKTAGLMKKSDFVHPRLSLESSREERQQKSGGKVDNRDLVRALDCLLQAGFRRPEILVYLMFGLPGQTPAEVENDIRFVHGLGVSVSLAAYSPIPGTAEYSRLIKDGSIPPDLDPLLHNNTVFSLRQRTFTLKDIRFLRDTASGLNRGLENPASSCYHQRT